MEILKFGKANGKLKQLQAKLGRKVAIFDMLAGHTCPFAKDCLSKAINLDGKRTIEDGKDTKFRCYAASLEVIYPAVYFAHEHNTKLIRTALLGGVNNVVDLITQSIPKWAEVIRIHSSGDFFHLTYFDAWRQVALDQPDRLFYAYTKATPFWVKRLDSIPPNMLLTASFGGKRDDLILSHNLRSSLVVKTVAEAKKLKLPIDKADICAATSGPSFALLIHGVQPKGSEYGKAVQKLKGKGSYGRKSTRKVAV